MSWQNSPYLIALISFVSGALVALLAQLSNHKLTTSRDKHSRKMELVAVMQIIMAELITAKEQFQREQAAPIPVITNGYDLLVNRGLTRSLPLPLFIDLHVAYWHLKSMNFVIDRVHIGKNDLIQPAPHIGDTDALLKFVEKSNRHFITMQQSVLKSLDKVNPQVKSFYKQLLIETATFTERIHYKIYNYFKPSTKTEGPQS